MEKWKRTAVFDHKCKNCGIAFQSKNSMSLFCEPECRIEFGVKKKASEQNLNYITCQICKRAVFNVVGSHLKKYHPEYTADLYHEEFPGHPVFAEHTLEQVRAGSIKAGARMREPEKREFFSKLMAGENNPMHRKNSSEELRRSISPFTPEFYLKKNPDLTLDEAQDMALSKNRKAMEGRLSWTQVEYWLKKGFNVDEAKAKISEIQKTFSLDICIGKHGIEEGTRIWNERQAKWIKNYKKNNFSLVSQELFVSLWDIVKDDFDDVYFATLNDDKEIIPNTDINYEFRLVLKNKTMLPDFFIESERLVIEFDGIYWHDHNRRNRPENKERESKRDQILLENGYRILRVNEKEWKESKEETINRCIDFIYAKNQGSPQKVHPPADQQDRNLRIPSSRSGPE